MKNKTATTAPTKVSSKIAVNGSPNTTSPRFCQHIRHLSVESIPEFGTNVAAPGPPGALSFHIHCKSRARLPSSDAKKCNESRSGEMKRNESAKMAATFCATTAAT
jgi:hypothetical protein